MDLFDYKNFPNIKNLSFSDLNIIKEEILERTSNIKEKKFFIEVPHDIYELAVNYFYGLLDVTFLEIPYKDKFEYRFKESPLNSELVIYKNNFDKFDLYFFGINLKH